MAVKKQFQYHNPTIVTIYYADSFSDQQTITDAVDGDILRRTDQGVSYIRMDHGWANFASTFLDNFEATNLTITNVDASALPTVDPAVAGQLWNDTGTVKVSAG